ncbi:uncharacterized protein LOC134254196 [Saccostrea cucullata]|uniref:uncharacterized protein LOC134254196 n=1 Tax=Saccostrea cuccullata TaxID=36930 RepID=UPI002ED25DB2
MISSSFSRSQKLVFSADDIKGWRFLSTVGENETSFIYVINTTNVCVGSICSGECDLTIIPEEDLSHLQNGTIKCKNRLQLKQCRMNGINTRISFSVKKSCRHHSIYTQLFVKDNKDNICGDDTPTCYKEFSFTSSTSQNPKDNETDNMTTVDPNSNPVSSSNKTTVYPRNDPVSTSNITTVDIRTYSVSSSNMTTVDPGSYSFSTSNMTTVDPGRYSVSTSNMTTVDPGRYSVSTSNMTTVDPGRYSVSTSNMTTVDIGTYSVSSSNMTTVDPGRYSVSTSNMTTVDPLSYTVSKNNMTTMGSGSSLASIMTTHWNTLSSTIMSYLSLKILFLYLYMISPSFSRSQKLFFSADDIKGRGSLFTRQCRMNGSSNISFSVKKSCRRHSTYAQLIVKDNIGNICGDDVPTCFKEVSFTSSTSQNHKDNATDFMTTVDSVSYSVSTSNITTMDIGISLASIKTTHRKTLSSTYTSNQTDLSENHTDFTTPNTSTPSCCELSKTIHPSRSNRKISKTDMDIPLAVTVSISVLVVSAMLFLIGRLLYKTRHVTKTDPSIASFDIVNPSDGVLEDPSGFLRETYIHIRKVSESNTDESPVSSPRDHNQDSYPEMGMSAVNSRQHYGEFSTFTGNRNSYEDFPHRYTAHNDRGDMSKPRKQL